MKKKPLRGTGLLLHEPLRPGFGERPLRLGSMAIVCPNNYWSGKLCQVIARDVVFGMTRFKVRFIRRGYGAAAEEQWFRSSWLKRPTLSEVRLALFGDGQKWATL